MPTVCDNVCFSHIRVNRMARRSVRRPKPPKPKAPVLTVEHKRRRIERFKKCIRDIEAFDPQNEQKRFGVPDVVALEAAIDKALLSAFGHGTSAFMRCNRAATFYHGPLIKNASVRGTVSPDSGKPRGAGRAGGRGSTHIFFRVPLSQGRHIIGHGVFPHLSGWRICHKRSEVHCAIVAQCRRPFPAELRQLE
jgi:hypothetical protein